MTPISPITCSTEQHDHTPKRYFNRELSWLAFNQRVLEEAGNPRHPLMERIKFLAISDDNLEEFYRVRVAGLYGQVEAGIEKQSLDGLSAQEQLKRIYTESSHLVTEIQQTWLKLCKDMAKAGVQILDPAELSLHENQWLKQYFEQQLFATLTPMAVDPAHPFPFIPNDGFVMVLNVKKKQKPKVNWALLPIPKMLPRFIQIENSMRYVLLEDILPLFFDQLFPGFTIEETGLAHVVRDSELDLNEEMEDMVEMFRDALKKRRHGNIIRLMVNQGFPQSMLDFMVEELEIEEQAIFPVEGRLNLSDLHHFRSGQFPPEFFFSRFNAPQSKRLVENNNNCFEAIQEGDLLVHHPYESFDAVMLFLRQAAKDPNVLAIKQTLYRTTKDSPITKALIEAAESGKAVTAVVELKARFDEETNISVADALERAGVHVVYGVLGLKTHAKMTLVVRREGKKMTNYAHFGTGNYHPITAKQYTDISFFTCDPVICEDMVKVFNFVTGYGIPKNLQKLNISPVNLQKRLLQQIDEEIANAKQGLPAQIWAKLNSLVDQTLIDALYRASQAGVKIELVVRGICCLRPGVKGLSENIHVKSIVGRFLEHSRIVCFANGQPLPSGQAKVFISSADWMPRNFYSRVETLVEITDEAIKHQLMNQMMWANLRDTAQSWQLQSDGCYKRLAKRDEIGFNAQTYFMGNPHLADQIILQ